MKRRYGLLIFIGAILLALLGAVLLVQNRQQAADQAKQIIIRDQAGTNVDTDLISLRVFAASHMKVNVAFVLTGSYNRAVAEAKAKSTTANATYAAAQASCDKKGVDSIRQSQCVAAYIAAHPTSAHQASLPNIADYSYHYIGPAWAFDIPGLLITAAAILAVLSVISVVHRTVTK